MCNNIGDHKHEDDFKPHLHKNHKAVINRVARAIGHLESTKRMLEDERDCTEVLVQLAAVKSAINNVGKIILKDHLSCCVLDAINNKDLKELERLNKAIDQFVK